MFNVGFKTFGIIWLGPPETLSQKGYALLIFQYIVVHKNMRVLEQIPSMKFWRFTSLGIHLYDWEICSKAAGSSLHGKLV